MPARVWDGVAYASEADVSRCSICLAEGDEHVVIPLRVVEGEPAHLLWCRGCTVMVARKFPGLVVMGEGS